MMQTAVLWYQCVASQLHQRDRSDFLQFLKDELYKPIS